MGRPPWLEGKLLNEVSPPPSQQVGIPEARSPRRIREANQRHTLKAVCIIHPEPHDPRVILQDPLPHTGVLNGAALATIINCHKQFRTPKVTSLLHDSPKPKPQSTVEHCRVGKKTPQSQANQEGVIFFFTWLLLGVTTHSLHCTQGKRVGWAQAKTEGREQRWPLLSQLCPLNRNPASESPALLLSWWQSRPPDAQLCWCQVEPRFVNRLLLLDFLKNDNVKHETVNMSRTFKNPENTCHHN